MNLLLAKVRQWFPLQFTKVRLLSIRTIQYIFLFSAIHFLVCFVPFGTNALTWDLLGVKLLPLILQPPMVTGVTRLDWLPQLRWVRPADETQVWSLSNLVVFGLLTFKDLLVKWRAYWETEGALYWPHPSHMWRFQKYKWNMAAVRYPAWLQDTSVWKCHQKRFLLRSDHTCCALILGME